MVQIKRWDGFSGDGETSKSLLLQQLTGMFCLLVNRLSKINCKWYVYRNSSNVYRNSSNAGITVQKIIILIKNNFNCPENMCHIPVQQQLHSNAHKSNVVILSVAPTTDRITTSYLQLSYPITTTTIYQCRKHKCRSPGSQREGSCNLSSSPLPACGSSYLDR